MNSFIDILPEIEKALLLNLPVVALESTIISHGMPYPKNVETAKMVEKMVRDNGAIPATIAIINGRLKVGLSEDELEYFGKKGMAITKVSRRDIPFILSQKMDGATTVASTMIIANMAGIKIFATGGIGGVHRGAEISMDISADLQELAKTNVTVVCAGIKSILDLGLTLEYLETQGVAVVGYQTDELPAFFSRKSGLKVDYNLKTPLKIAETIQIKSELKLQGGIIIANPIPLDSEVDFSSIEKIIQKALLEADENNIKGKDITPFLLAKIEKLTKGESLNANIQLVLNNAKLAALIASKL